MQKQIPNKQEFLLSVTMNWQALKTKDKQSALIIKNKIGAFLFSLLPTELILASV